MNYLNKLLAEYSEARSRPDCNCDQLEDMGVLLTSIAKICGNQETIDAIDELYFYISVELDEQASKDHTCTKDER